MTGLPNRPSYNNLLVHCAHCTDLRATFSQEGEVLVIKLTFFCKQIARFYKLFLWSPTSSHFFLSIGCMSSSPAHWFNVLINVRWLVIDYWFIKMLALLEIRSCIHFYIAFACTTTRTGSGSGSMALVLTTHHLLPSNASWMTHIHLPWMVTWLVILLLGAEKWENHVTY